MTSRSKNVNLNKEPFEGYVRHWKRQWVFQGDRSKEDKGAWTLRLIKWVRTESRVSSGPARHPHIAPVTDLSLVPGARIGGQAAEGAAVSQPAAAGATSVQQQQQQPQGTSAAPAAAVQQQQQQAIGAPPLQAAGASSAFVSATTTVAAAAAASTDAALPRATSLNALSIDMPGGSSQQDGAAGAAAAVGPPSFILPSPSVVTGGAFGFSHPSVGQLQLQTAGSDFAQYAAGGPSTGGAATASGYTAGTERTDSDALGRLPHAGGPAASEYTDSMDVDMDGAGGASQGGVSQQRHGGISLVAGSMDTAGDMDDLDEDEDAEGDEEAEGDEDAEGDGDDMLDDEDDDNPDHEDDEDDQGYADDGLGDVGDMP